MTDTRTVGDHGTSETLELSGAGLSLAGATGVAHIKRPDRTVVNQPVTITGTTAAFTWSPGDLNVPGTYTVEVEVTYSNGATQTFSRSPSGSGVRLDVLEQFA